jgi:hypothetical protein
MTEEFKLSLPGVEQEFWAQVDKSGTCWLWKGDVSRAGAERKKKSATPYGMFRFAKILKVAAHRMAWILTHGFLPPTDLVLHIWDGAETPDFSPGRKRRLLS